MVSGGTDCPKSFMAENTVFLLLTALIRNFYKAIIQRLDVKRFGLNATSRIKAFVFRFISRTSQVDQDIKAVCAEYLYL